MYADDETLYRPKCFKKNPTELNNEEHGVYLNEEKSGTGGLS
jgi:hypothetical protein